jgi:KDO2-lipid IV(A) lauroyltransferase
MAENLENSNFICVWKHRIFNENLRLTRPFFENAGVRQPNYFEVLQNMIKDVRDFVFPKENSDFEVDKASIPVFEEMRYGGIFLTAHYGNHELLGYRLASLGLPLNSASQKQKPEFFDRWLQKKRSYRGKCFAKQMETGAIIEFVSSGGLFALLADQDFRKPAPRAIKEQCESTFLGVKVRCNPLPAFILEHLPKTPVFCGYLQGGKSENFFVPTIFLKKIPTENFYDSYHSWLEELVLKNPAKWYGWFHNRHGVSLRRSQKLSAKTH